MDEQKTTNASSQGKTNGAQQRYFVPHCDIYERKDALVVLADMPSVERKDIDLDLEKGVLTITGRVQHQNGAEERQLRREYSEGSYRRVLHLPDEIDPDKIEASVKDGVLRIVLPKSDRARSRKIEVRTH